jgi:hypothetical protein
MYTLSRTGSIAEVIRQVRDVPERVIPYAASTALTRVALTGRARVLAEMPRVFDRPTPYALRGTRVIPSTVQKLAARVQVNEDATNNGTPAERFFFPEVYGGPRSEKRFERTLRYSGVLGSGYFAMPGQAAPLDAYGNLKASELQRIFTAIRSSFDKYQNKTSSRRSKKNAKKAPYFVVGTGTSTFVGGEHVFKKSRIQPGIYRRQGRDVKPVLIFTNKAPVYRKRLDFEGIVKRAAEEQFADEFRKAADAIISRRSAP